MPDVNAEFTHHLTADQRETAKNATQTGREANTKEIALRNILQTYEDKDAALQDLAAGTAKMNPRIQELYQRQQGGSRLTVAEQEEYDALQAKVLGNQQLERALPNAFEQARADRIADWHSKPVEELIGNVQSMQSGVANAERARNIARRDHGTVSHEYRDAQARLNRIKGEFTTAQNILDERQKPEKETAASQAAQQKEAQRLREEARLKQQTQELKSKDVAGLRQEVTDLDRQSTEIQTRLTNAQTASAPQEQIDEIQRELDSNISRRSEADAILGDKLQTTTESVNEDVARSNEQDFIRRATGQEITQAIDRRTQEVTNTRNRVQNLRNRLNNPALTADQRRDLQGEIYDETQNLRRSEDNLALYQDALYKSNKEFRDMDGKQRGEELGRIIQEINVDDFDLQDIHDRLVNGDRVTKEEEAAWASRTADNIAELGLSSMTNGDGVHAETLYSILSTRPELQNFIVDKLSRADSMKSYMREHHPRTWQKIWDFARKNPQFLILLLALIGGGVALAAGPATSAMGLGSMMAR